MDSLFFIASKTVGMLARLETWVLLALLAALLAGAAGRRRAAHRIVAGVLALLLGLTALPLGLPLMRLLENQYPAAPALPDRVDGIIVLGGAEDTAAYARWGLAGMNDAAERMTAGWNWPGAIRRRGWSLPAATQPAGRRQQPAPRPK
ncbi:MAG: hypothetical protein R3D63_13060 [Paracoccaceae bacterium]